jgi:NAD(P)-dependent dehydrogenase (short-subunit alcohol dehydrogenase family)
MDIHKIAMSIFWRHATATDKNRPAILSSMSRNLTDKKIAVVTGSSSGIGFETSILLAKYGFHTYATVRNPSKVKVLKEVSDKGELPIQVVELDVDSDKSVKDAIDRIYNESGRVDVLINNAGYSLLGALEDISMDELKAQFETNLFGPVRVMKSVLPIMRKQQEGGTIVNVSSMSGRLGFPFLSAYAASKFAIEGLTESLVYEIQPFDIKLVLIEPGITKTNFVENGRSPNMAAAASSPYTSLSQKILKSASTLMQSATPPVEVAKVILKAVTTDNPDLRYRVGNDADQMVEARNAMSDREWQQLIKQQYLVE